MAIASRTYDDITSFIQTNAASLSSSSTLLEEVLHAFVRTNEDPSCSPNFSCATEDNIDYMLHLLASRDAQARASLQLLLLQALKILSRKRCNRQQFGQDGIAAVLEHLAATSLTKRAAAEAANVILNVCYEKSNVELVLELGGIQKLVKLLADRDPDVQANAAGAIQSICFQDSGRHGVREAGAVTPLVQLLDSPQSKVQARAVGALHNLSSDSNSIRLIRRGGGIPKLVHLLRSHSWAVCGSAAGALQNVSREVASRMVVRELDTVCPLAELLAAPDLQAQVCAAGALLNILGPELEHSKYGVAQRHGLAALMAQALALAMVSDCLTPVGLRHPEQSLPVG